MGKTEALITPEDLASHKKEGELSTRQKFFYGSGCVFELTKWIIVLLVVGTLIHYFIGTLFIVDGQSMEPNFHNGQYIIVNRWQYNFGKPERGDVVVLKFPGDPEHKKYIKRVIGLPGDHVQIKDDGYVYINNQKLNESYIPYGVMTRPNVDRIMGADDYYLIGDNRYNSSDSRIWGVAPRRDLIGKTWLTIWPFSSWGLTAKPKY